MVCKVFHRFNFDIWTFVGAFFQDEIRADRPDAPVVCTVDEFDMARIAASLLLVGCPYTCDATLVRWFLGYVVEMFMELWYSHKDRF